MSKIAAAVVALLPALLVVVCEARTMERVLVTDAVNQV